MRKKCVKRRKTKLLRPANLGKLVAPHVHFAVHNHAPSKTIPGRVLVEVVLEGHLYEIFADGRQVGWELDVEVDYEVAPGVRILDQRQAFADYPFLEARPDYKE